MNKDQITKQVYERKAKNQEEEEDQNAMAEWGGWDTQKEKGEKFKEQKTTNQGVYECDESKDKFQGYKTIFGSTPSIYRQKSTEGCSDRYWCKLM